MLAALPNFTAKPHLWGAASVPTREIGDLQAGR
jgi:hypothetical protein